MKKTILITGGAGFLGSHLCEQLLKDGNKVFCIDNFLTGTKENISHLFSNPNFKFIQHDIVIPLIIKDKIDEIYNLASPASPVHYQKHPIETIKTNTVGVINVLDLALRNKAKILQASTSEVYGNPLKHPQTEDYWGNVNPIGPRACYDESKRCAETLFFNYHRIYKLCVKIVRIFNTYGPKMTVDDGRVVSGFILQALNNKSLRVYGDGTQTRSFCYVDDLLAGIIKMMASSYTGPFNLGNLHEITVLELAEKVILLSGTRSKINYLPLSQDDPLRRRPDISKAKKYLKWEPKIDIDSGLIKTIAFFKSQLNSN